MKGAPQRKVRQVFKVDFDRCMETISNKIVRKSLLPNIQDPATVLGNLEICLDYQTLSLPDVQTPPARMHGSADTAHGFGAPRPARKTATDLPRRRRWTLYTEEKDTNTEETDTCFGKYYFSTFLTLGSGIRRRTCTRLREAAGDPALDTSA